MAHMRGARIVGDIIQRALSVCFNSKSQPLRGGSPDVFGVFVASNSVAQMPPHSLENFCITIRRFRPVAVAAFSRRRSSLNRIGVGALRFAGRSRQVRNAKERPENDTLQRNERDQLDSGSAHDFNRNCSGVPIGLIGQEGIRCVSSCWRGKSGAAPATVGGELSPKCHWVFALRDPGRRRRAETREPGDLPEQRHLPTRGVRDWGGLPLW